MKRTLSNILAFTLILSISLVNPPPLYANELTDIESIINNGYFTIGSDYETVKLYGDLTKVSTGDVYKSDSYFTEVMAGQVDKSSMLAKVLLETGRSSSNGTLGVEYGYYPVGEYKLRGVSKYLIERDGEPVVLGSVASSTNPADDYTNSKYILLTKNNVIHSYFLRSKGRPNNVVVTAYLAFSVNGEISTYSTDDSYTSMKTDMPLTSYSTSVKSVKETIPYSYYSANDYSANRATIQSLSLLVDMYKNGIKASLDTSALSAIENTINSFTDEKVNNSTSSLNTSILTSTSNLTNLLNNSTSSINNSINSITDSMISSEFNIARGKPLPFTGTRIKTNYLSNADTELYRTNDNKLVIVKWYKLPTTVGDLIIQ